MVICVFLVIMKKQTKAVITTCQASYDHKEKRQQKDSYTTIQLSVLLRPFLLCGELCGVAFETVVKRSSFCPEGGLQYSHLGTKRHSLGFVCNITGATELLFELQTSLSACALPFDGCCYACPLCTEHPGTSTDRKAVRLLFLERERFNCWTHIPGVSSAV